METARPGRSRSEASRLAILEATRDELVERGYDKLSLERIAAAAGVGKQTIYRWYPSKSALVAEGVLHGHLMDHIDLPDTGDIRADLTHWLMAFAGAGPESDSAALIRATSAATAEDETVAARYEEQVTVVVRTALRARLTAGMEVGQVRRDAPVTAVVESLVGTVLFRVLTRQPVSAEFVADLVSLLFSGIGGSDSTPRV